MPVDSKQLTREWIRFLKNNQIAVSSSENPGRLDYKRTVSSEDLSRFLEVKTDFSEEDVSNAIHMVLAKKAQGATPKKLQKPSSSAIAVRPPERMAPLQIQGNKPPPKKRFSKDNATDIEYRDINEALVDDAGYTLDEDDVELIFSILTSKVPAASKSRSDTPAKPQQSPEENEAKKFEELNKLRRLIRETLTTAQRKALWRALKDA